MTSRKHRSRARAVVALVAVMLTGSLAASAAAEIPPDAANHPLLQPIDAQNWVDQGGADVGRLHADPARPPGTTPRRRPAARASTRRRSSCCSSRTSPS